MTAAVLHRRDASFKVLHWPKLFEGKVWTNPPWGNGDGSGYGYGKGNGYGDSYYSSNGTDLGRSNGNGNGYGGSK